MELTIFLTIVAMWLVFFVLSWLSPLIIGRLVFGVFALILSIVIAVLTYQVELVSVEPVVTSITTAWANTTVIPAGSEQLMNWTNTYTYSLDASYTTTLIPNVWMFGFLFFGFFAVSIMQLVMDASDYVASTNERRVP